MDLGVIVVKPTPADRPRHQRKKKIDHAPTRTPSPPREELDIAAIPLEDSSIEMMFQRSEVTLAQILATPIVPKTQTPSTPAANALVAIQTAPVTMAAATPT